MMDRIDKDWYITIELFFNRRWTQMNTDG